MSRYNRNIAEFPKINKYLNNPYLPPIDVKVQTTNLKSKFALQKLGRKGSQNEENSTSFFLISKRILFDKKKSHSEMPFHSSSMLICIPIEN